MQINITALLADDTPGVVNGERKRLHAARLNSIHLRQPVGAKRMLQLAYEEIERLLPLEYELARFRRAGWLRRTWRRFF